MLSKFLQSQKNLYVQPRMGMASLRDMQKGLKAVKELDALTIGTITLDSYTRTQQFEKAEKALRSGLDLNGFPLLAYSQEEIADNLSCLMEKDFFIQVRHGTANPEQIFKHLVKSHLFLTEGGPISYCLPYSQSPLKNSINSWKKGCEILARYPLQSHLESFAGCILGQLCHPTILVAVGILEGLFFQKNGLRDISLSYAQHYNIFQDVAAVAALKRLAQLYFSKEVAWHIVIYTFMGIFPQTLKGHEEILKESVSLAKISEAKRLIVKTHDESSQIPSVKSNLEALKKAYEYSHTFLPLFNYDKEEEEIIFFQSKAIIECVLNLHQELETGLFKAFNQGYLDVPFCLHQDNLRLATCAIDPKGYLQWVSTGKLPIKVKPTQHFLQKNKLNSQKFMEMLEYNRIKFDFQKSS